MWALWEYRDGPLSGVIAYMQRRSQAVHATQALMRSAGVSNSIVCRGRLLSLQATLDDANRVPP
jgi:hypothetical protein